MGVCPFTENRIAQTIADGMKISPPIVTVPCLRICERGPKSLIVCPTFSFFSHGIRIGPTSIAATNDASTAKINLCIFRFLRYYTPAISSRSS